jgi:hypothetical protein
MTNLVVCLGTGKGTWAHVAKLVNAEEWEKIYFVTSEYFSGKFEVRKPHEFIVVDIKKPLKLLAEDIRKSLYGKIADLEVGVNFISGTGKEHMAIVSALTRLGLGIRLIAFTGEKAEEI